MALQRAVYRPRNAEHIVLHQVIAEHLEAFLRAVAEAGDGAGLPQFVEREFREFLTCGVFEHGVARFRCEGCAREHLVPFRVRVSLNTRSTRLYALLLPLQLEDRDLPSRNRVREDPGAKLFNFTVHRLSLVTG